MKTSIEKALDRANAANHALHLAEVEYTAARAALQAELLAVQTSPMIAQCEVCAAEFPGSGQVCDGCAETRGERPL